jgi:hypothetical protein
VMGRIPPPAAERKTLSAREGWRLSLNRSADTLG